MKQETEKKKPAKELKNTEMKNLVGTRGRTFEGAVIRKFPMRLTIEFERTLFLPKYERFMKKKTRIHARLPKEVENQVEIGDLVQVRECRPLSKIIHFMFVKVVRKAEATK